MGSRGCATGLPDEPQIKIPIHMLESGDRKLKKQTPDSLSLSGMQKKRTRCPPFCSAHR